MRSPVCVRSLPWSGDVAALSHSLVDFLVRWRCVLLQKDLDRAICARSSPSDDQESLSYVGHVVATVPDKSPTARYQGHCLLVGLLRLPCHVARGIVRGLA
ncbi:hypothetical protein B296_00012920 [Ensete ventricosum]|uniref:Uncharacterized protein n=1 Tax=Ensete ventricosum TaxID=4639 RepID=A0A426XIH6_ENSVE|nr:hypothetical protein B296_00012920 [Ensete ventricosum]